MRLPTSIPGDKSSFRVWRQSSLKNRLFVTILVSCTALLVGFSWQSWRARHIALEHSQRESASLVRSLAVQVGTLLTMMDSTLDSLGERYEFSIGTEVYSQRLARVMRRRLQLIPLLRSISVANRSGTIVASTSATDVGTSIANSESFRYSSIHEGGALHIAGERTVNGDRVVLLTHRINNPRGLFLGVINAAVPEVYFTKLFEHINLLQGGVISLTRADGIVLARDPFNRTFVGKSIAKSNFFRKRLSKSPVGTYEAYSILDGMQREFAYERVPSYPVVVLVAQESRDVFAEWQIATFVNAALICGLVLAVALLGGRLGNEIDRRDNAERQLLVFAFHDGLTGLANRRKFDEILDNEWRRAIRNGDVLSLLMIDVDFSSNTTIVMGT